MKYFYKYKFTAQLDAANQAMYFTGDTILNSDTGTTFSKSNGAVLPNYTIIENNIGLNRYIPVNSGIGFQGDYSLSKVGVYDIPSYITSINNKFYAITRHKILESTDKINWIEYDQPPLLYGFEFVYTNQGTAAALCSTFISDPIVGPTIHPVSSGYEIPSNFKYLCSDKPTASYYDITPMSGYIAKEGYWSPRPVNYLNYPGGYSQAGYSTIRLSTNEINCMLEFRDLNKHWDPIAWNSSNYSYSGNFVSNYPVFQVACCDNGYIYTRVFTSASASGSIYSTQPFIELYLGNPDKVYFAYNYAFMYDEDTAYQSNSTRVLFEKLYVITGLGVYSLTYDDVIGFEANLIATGITGKVISIQIETRRKWSDWPYVIYTTEIHKLHIHGENGMYLVIDASDKTLPTTVSLIDNSASYKFKRCFTGAAFGSTAYVTDDNKVYIQNQYNVFTYVLSLPEDIISISTSGTVLYVTTTRYAYLYSKTFGLSAKIGLEILHWYSDYYGNSKVLTSGNPSIGFANGHFIVIDRLARIFFTYDFITWTYAAKVTSGLYNFDHISWVYRDGVYAACDIYGTQYIDTVTKTTKFGLSPSMPMLANTKVIFLNDKLLVPQFGSDGTVIIDPLNPTYGLKSPAITGPIETVSPQAVYYTDISVITFNWYVDKSLEPAWANTNNISMELYGKCNGVIITAIQSPITGQEPYKESGLDHIMYYPNQTYADKKRFTASATTEYYPASGLRTFTIKFRKFSSYAIDFDIIILNIKVNNQVVLNNQFDQISYTITGSSFLGIVAHPYQYHTMRDQYMHDIYDEPVADNRVVSFVQHANELYLLHRIGDNYTGIKQDPKIYDITTKKFKPIADSVLRDRIKLASVGVTYYDNLTNFVTTKYVTSNTIISTMPSTSNYVIDGVCPATVICKQGKFYDYFVFLVGENGYFAYVHMVNMYFSVKKLTVNNLHDLIKITYTDVDGTHSRVIVVGENGYLAYSDDTYTVWTELQLGVNNLNRIHYDSNLNKLVVIGDNGVVYYSTNKGEAWEQIDIGSTSSLKVIIRDSTSGKTVLAGNDQIFVSTNLLDWTLIVTNLNIDILSACDFYYRIYLGGKDGKLIASSDLYNWSYEVTNTSSHIKELHSLYDNSYERNVWYISGILQPNTLPPSQVLQIGEEVSATLQFKNMNRKFILKVLEIADPYFKLGYVRFAEPDGTVFTFQDPPEYLTQSNTTQATTSRSFSDVLTWTDVFKLPNIKMYTDSSCTQEILGKVYPSTDVNNFDNYALYFDRPGIVNKNTIIASFDTDIDVSSIEYIVFSGVTRIYNTQNQIIESFARLYTVSVASYDILNNTVTSLPISRPSDSSCMVSTYWPYSSDYLFGQGTTDRNTGHVIGIARNSLHAKFIQSANTCEHLEISVWFKLTDPTKYYDNLVILSRSPYDLADFYFSEFYDSVAGGYRNGVMHNASVVKHSMSKKLSVYFIRDGSTYLTHPTLYKIFSDNPLILNYFGEGSICTTRGVVLTASNVNTPVIDGSIKLVDTDISNSSVRYGFPQATANLEHPYYAPEEYLWYTSSGTSGDNAESLTIYKAKDIRTIPGDVTFNPADLAGGGYYYVHSPSGGFLELKDISNAEIFMNGVHIPAGSTYYLFTDAFRYHSPELISIKPYSETANYVTTYRVPRAYTGILQYVVVHDSYDYSSSVLQPLYKYTPGTLEFNIDTEPNKWKSTLELPPITNLSTVKVNIRESGIVNGVSYRPFNTIRLSGVEYTI